MSDGLVDRISELEGRVSVLEKHRDELDEHDDRLDMHDRQLAALALELKSHAVWRERIEQTLGEVMKEGRGVRSDLGRLIDEVTSANGRADVRDRSLNATLMRIIVGLDLPLESQDGP